ncbi:MAG: hypothetical protein K0V04_38620 [Deltaproteobacteria bacterium]|nr:hypothetical protein [Deltaproteobacteria bacterium]
MNRETKGALRARFAGLLAIFGLGAAASACLNFGSFSCDDDADCDAEDMGQCEPVGYCSYPDLGCLATGYRYEPNAGDGLGGQCVGEDVAGSGTDSPNDSETSTDSNTGLDTASETTMNVDPTSDTTDDPGTTGEACGAGGQACCMGSTCDAGLACTGGLCGCVSEVAVGDRHSCAVKLDGSLWCWGDNLLGQLADGALEQSMSPVPIPGFGPGAEVQSISARTHTCAVRNGNVAVCWGDNTSQKVDFGAPIDVITSPVDATWANPAVRVGVGGNHSCVSRGLDMPLVCWGDNSSGQLTGVDMPTPQDVTLGAAIDPAALAMGQAHSCVAALTGELYCWGSNAFGQLGLDTTAIPSTNVVNVVPIVPVGSVVAGTEHTCATAGSDVVCWGRNDLGQVGDGTTANTFVPTTVQFPLGAGAISTVVAAGNHTCALSATGALFCWGGNELGELMLEQDKNGVDMFTLSPQEIDVGFEIAQLATSVTHTCALSTAGQVYCWGGNDYGQIGDGTTTKAQDATEVGLDCP